MPVPVFRACALCVCVAAIAADHAPAAAGTYKVLKTITIGGNGG